MAFESQGQLSPEASSPSEKFAQEYTTLLADIDRMESLPTGEREDRALGLAYIRLRVVCRELNVPYPFEQREAA